MNDIMVCVKQVPNTTNIKLDPVRHTLIREGVPSVLNPFDEVALDAALSCKTRFGAKVGVLTMGPPQAEGMLEMCLGWGADEAFLLTDRRLAGSDTLATARALRAAILAAGYTTVFCGQETADSSTGHLGPSLAEMFHVPQATSVTRVIALSDSLIEVEVEQEHSVQVLQLKLPAVVSFAKAGRTDGRAAARRSGKVRRLTLEEIGLKEDQVGLEGSPTTVVDIDIDLDSLNYLVVDDRLNAFDRIATVLRGGITENERRVIFRSMTEEAYQALLALLQ
jgi:electron transfer flavoprotein beta subunit